ncbi:DUF6777 domain-containing protein [Streptomyces sanyensis]
MQRLSVAAATACVGLLAAGCGGTDAPPGPEELLLQPTSARGAGAYAPSAAVRAPAFAPPAVTAAPASPSGGGTTLRTLSGAAPGLYGGLPERASCDVPALTRHLSADRAEGRAFATAAEIEHGDVAAFLRGLTPVVLRADTRITGHRLADGGNRAHQAVLQAGTAVLVDHFGAPRVRCADASPLGPPVPAERAVVPRGRPWDRYRPDQAIVVKPAEQVVSSLLLVSTADGSWIERPSGTGGEEDARPEVLPPVAAEEVFADPALAGPGAGAGQAPATSGDTGSAPAGQAPEAPLPDVPAYDPLPPADLPPADVPPPQPDAAPAPEPLPDGPDAPPVLPDVPLPPASDPYASEYSPG